VQKGGKEKEIKKLTYKIILFCASSSEIGLVPWQGVGSISQSFCVFHGGGNMGNAEAVQKYCFCMVR
jgi:hypothetical protein